MRIWKFGLTLDGDVQTIYMPRGARLLTIQTQGGEPQLWALCAEGVQTVPRTFATYGTGHPIPDRSADSYVGTYQSNDGAGVWHVFEVFGGQGVGLAELQPSWQSTLPQR